MKKKTPWYAWVLLGFILFYISKILAENSAIGELLAVFGACFIIAGIAEGIRHRKKRPATTIVIGKDEAGQDFTVDLSALKHLLVAGATGSGKSVLLHRVITTLHSQNSHKNVTFILADSKRVELPVYNAMSQILFPVLVNPIQMMTALEWVVKEMDSRYKRAKRMPPIIVIIDELSDLIQTYPYDAEALILKIADKGHIVGIHMILATSRPSPSVLTNSILNAIEARIVMQTGSTRDSEVLIGVGDAYNLRGKGDMLFRPGALQRLIRVQVANIPYDEVQKMMAAISS